MRFLFTFLMGPAHPPSPTADQKCFAEMMAFVDELKAGGQFVFDSQVMPSSPRVRIPSTHPEVAISDGQQDSAVGGSFVIEVDCHAAAVRLAERYPHLQPGAVEVRQLNETQQIAWE